MTTFKIGDKVRLTREAIINIKIDLPDCYYTGFTIDNIEGEVVYGGGTRIHNEYLELVPEEPEFKQGELIEVRDREYGDWTRLPFIYKIPGEARNHYITVTALDVHAYNNNQDYSVEGWRYARKIRPELSRKKIAEKFGIPEDFTLID